MRKVTRNKGRGGHSQIKLCWVCMPRTIIFLWIKSSFLYMENVLLLNYILHMHELKMYIYTYVDGDLRGLRPDN